MRVQLKQILPAILFMGSSGSGFCQQTGVVENTFETNGISGFHFGFTANEEHTTGLALRINGKIVLGGTTSYSFSVAQYAADGIPDSSFGTNGFNYFGSGAISANCGQMKLKLDGKIVEAGYVENSATSMYNSTVVQFDSSGHIDGSFGTSGYVRLAGFTPTSDQSGAFTLAIQADQKIVIGGVHIDAVSSRFATAGFNFRVKWSRYNIVSHSRIWTGVELAVDGKILVVGYKYSPHTTFAIAGYSSGMSVGVKDFSAPTTSVLCYPHPTRNVINLKMGDESNNTPYCIRDIQEKILLRNQLGENENQIDVSGLPAGVYLI